MFHYKVASIWIFAALLLLVATLIFWPNAWFAGLSMAILPFLVILQTIVVLKNSDADRAPLSDDQWFENS